MQKTAYDMLMSDWSSDVCASDLAKGTHADQCLEMQGGTVTLKNVAEIASWYIYLTNSNMLRRDGHRQARCPVTARTWSRSARSRIVTSSTAKPPSSGRPRCQKIGRAHVGTPGTNAHLVCRLLLEKTT